MNILSKDIKMKWFFPIIALLLIWTIGLSIWYFYLPKTDEKLNAILSGLITGFVALALQVWFSWVEIKKIEKFDDLKIVNILPTRNDPEYYRPLLKNAKKEVRVLGVTCQRFLNDFANTEKSAPEKNKVLLKGLDGGKLKLKILVADENGSGLDQDNKAKATAVRPQLELLSNKYPDQFFYAFYKHPPTHSVMVIDGESIVGPVFPDVSSQFSPAIHLKNESRFVEHYLQYFDDEWAQCFKGKIN